nr:beta-galactosidase small subunit [Streptomyces sp. A1547]
MRPQENGNRADSRWATLTDRAGNGPSVVGEEPFHFAARRWTDQQLDAARHHSDLVPVPVIHLRTDRAIQGLGTAAGDPVSSVLPQYRPRIRVGGLRVPPASRAAELSPPSGPARALPAAPGRRAGRAW